MWCHYFIDAACSIVDDVKTITCEPNVKLIQQPVGVVIWSTSLCVCVCVCVFVCVCVLVMHIVCTHIYVVSLFYRCCMFNCR